jgi:hypothetical protein
MLVVVQQWYRYYLWYSSASLVKTETYALFPAGKFLLDLNLLFAFFEEDNKLYKCPVQVPVYYITPLRNADPIFTR